ncbi:uncharacterized protein EKO05_0006494 [Ascochyta rabiei]|uniref:uncharacterized protein n=1 Tax=Didymella rabiei TaxID=5454 RepID=UPI0021FF16FF|nr:uncharacterized protein EKO05_0006494 [Ascochyta rabiei]UPX16070.1 hypothetical protein EKO05_0006494 [Ascochyta rabiei]
MPHLQPLTVRAEPTAALGRPPHHSGTLFEQDPLLASFVVYGVLVKGVGGEGICEVSGKGGDDGVLAEGVLLCYMSVRSKVAFSDLHFYMSSHINTI